MRTDRFRDLTLVDINKNQRLVIACDSAGGIGDKELDSVRTSQEVIGYYTASVALMEVLSYGAWPISLINNLAVEMDPAGRGIIRGIEKALEPLGLDQDIVSGSTEENIPVKTTGLGVTVIGIVDRTSWTQARSYQGDLVVVLGQPKLGDQVVEDGGRTIMNVKRLLKLKGLDYIHEVLPVGSKGIDYELGQLAKSNGLDYEPIASPEIDRKTSAGPSSCVLASLNRQDYTRLLGELDIKICKIAYLKG